MNIQAIAQLGTYLALLALGLALFIATHYICLQKILKTKYPFEDFRKKHMKRLKSLHPAYYAPIPEDIPGWQKHMYGITRYIGTLGLYVMLLSFTLLITLYFLPKNLARALLLPLIGKTYLLLTVMLTAILLFFSKTFFNKPLKETGKAIISSGVLAYSILALYLYLLNYVPLYRHVKQFI